MEEAVEESENIDVRFSQGSYTRLNVDVDKDNENYESTKILVCEFGLQDGDVKLYQANARHVYNATTGYHHLKHYEKSFNIPGAKRATNDCYIFTYEVNGSDSRVKKNYLKGNYTNDRKYI